jgi:hypothetical protein
VALERFKKFYSRSERGLLGLGEASAKTHARSGLQLSRNEAKTQKDRFFLSPPEWLQHFLNRSKAPPHERVALGPILAESDWSGILHVGAPEVGASRKSSMSHMLAKKRINATYGTNVTL